MESPFRVGVFHCTVMGFVWSWQKCLFAFVISSLVVNFTKRDLSLSLFFTRRLKFCETSEPQLPFEYSRTNQPCMAYPRQCIPSSVYTPCTTRRKTSVCFNCQKLQRRFELLSNSTLLEGLIIILISERIKSLCNKNIIVLAGWSYSIIISMISRN